MAVFFTLVSDHPATDEYLESSRDEGFYIVVNFIKLHGKMELRDSNINEISCLNLRWFRFLNNLKWILADLLYRGMVFLYYFSPNVS